MENKELTHEEIEELIRQQEVNKDFKLEITIELKNIDEEGRRKIIKRLQDEDVIPATYKIKGLYSRWLPWDYQRSNVRKYHDRK